MEAMDAAHCDSDIVPTRRRLEVNTYLVLAAMLAGSVLVGDIRVFTGTLLGGILGLVNYHWLASSLAVIIPAAAEIHRVPKWTAAKFILRYFVVGVAIGIALWTESVSLPAVVVGFCAFVWAIMIEAGYQIYLMIFHSEESTK